MKLIIGLVLIFISKAIAIKDWSQQEWRIPLQELGSELEGGKRKKNRSKVRKSTVLSSFFF